MVSTGLDVLAELTVPSAPVRRVAVNMDHVGDRALLLLALAGAAPTYLAVIATIVFNAALVPYGSA